MDFVAYFNFELIEVKEPLLILEGFLATQERTLLISQKLLTPCFRHPKFGCS